MCCFKESPILKSNPHDHGWDPLSLFPSPIEFDQHKPVDFFTQRLSAIFKDFQHYKNSVLLPLATLPLPFECSNQILIVDCFGHLIFLPLN